MSTFEIGEVVATRRFSDGAEIIGRIAGPCAGIWAVVDARKLIWRRATDEIWRVPPSDPRAKALADAAALLTPSPPKDIPSPPKDEPPQPTLVERVLEALDAGVDTAVDIADRIGVDALRVVGALGRLAHRGVVARTGKRVVERGQWRLVWGRVLRQAQDEGGRRAQDEGGRRAQDEGGGQAQDEGGRGAQDEGGGRARDEVAR